MFLTIVDAEVDGQISSASDGEDAGVNVDANAHWDMSAWIDFNRHGGWDYDGKEIFTG